MTNGERDQGSGVGAGDGWFAQKSSWQPSPRRRSSCRVRRCWGQGECSGDPRGGRARAAHGARSPRARQRGQIVKICPATPRRGNPRAFGTVLEYAERGGETFNGTAALSPLAKDSTARGGLLCGVWRLVRSGDMALPVGRVRRVSARVPLAFPYGSQPLCTSTFE
jgi:hypothetical protein